ncbi:Zn-dependent hydrolase [Thermoleophilia bacterium SCSIO 60948]|nr:Zn-dependent hydrolase [Thermoleophilia bacterium SCSIO 60948]
MTEARAAIDAARVIAELRELDRLTGGPGGAWRVAWGPVWREAREWLGALTAELGCETWRDSAGNEFHRLRGAADGHAVAVGSHLDSVADGGWLDGALGVVAGLGCVRAWAEAGGPPRDIVLCDWADEEGSRFGHSLLGSSAAAGTLDAGAAAELTDADGVTLGEALAENGLDAARLGDAESERPNLGAYLELHIEQGPVLESEGLAASAVRGTAGVERFGLRFGGRASHAGTTPMDQRRDAGLAAAGTALETERVAIDLGGVATAGRLELSPGATTIIPGEAELLVDLRHPDPDLLGEMLARVRGFADLAASERGCSVAMEPIWRIAPIAFDAGLVALAGEAVCESERGRAEPLTSGALHDAANVALWAPVAMVFSSSIGGLSHNRDEDTSEEDLRIAIEAYGATVGRVLAR